jgi:hypothetical protein
MRRLTLLRTFAVLFVAAAVGCNQKAGPTIGVEPKSDKVGDYTTWSAGGGDSLIEGDQCGFFPGAIMFHNKRPVVWFGLIKQPKEKSKFLYMLLFKSPENAGNMSCVTGQEHYGPSLVQDSMDRIRVTGKTDLKLDDKWIETSYEADSGRKTNALIKEALKIGGKEIKPGEPRVFLVDLTQDKVSYQPVKVELPDEAPEATSGPQTWGPTVMRAIEQLKEKSAEVKSFLEEKPKR